MCCVKALEIRAGHSDSLRCWAPAAGQAEGIFGDQQNGAKYRLATVERGDISSYVSATGTLNPVIMVQVGTQVSGTIEKLFADYNSSVQEGQIIALLDQASFRAKVAQADAEPGERPRRPQECTGQCVQCCCLD